jgi:hypothetical protein
VIWVEMLAIMLITGGMLLPEIRSVWRRRFTAEKTLPYSEKDYYECLDLIYDGKPPLDEIDQKRWDEIRGVVSPAREEEMRKEMYKFIEKRTGIKEKPLGPPDFGKLYIDNAKRRVEDMIYKNSHEQVMQKGLFTDYDLKSHRAFCMDCQQWIPLEQAPRHVHRMGEYTDN